MQRNGTSCCEFDGKSMEIEIAAWSEFPNGGKANAEQILVSEERNKSKRARLWESQSGMKIVVDFLENIWNFGIAMKQSESRI